MPQHLARTRLRATSSQGIVWGVLAVATVIGLGAIYWQFQRPLEIRGGLGWDGFEYSNLYLNLLESHESVHFPYCQRVGTPLLAQFVGGTALHAFKVVNLIAAVLLPATLWTSARLAGYAPFYRFVAVFLSAGTFFAPLRFSQFAPVYTDPWFLVLLACAMLALQKGQTGLMFAFVVLAYPVREAALPLLPFFLAASLYLRVGRTRQVLLQSALALLAVITVRATIAGPFGCVGSSWADIVHHVWQLAADPQQTLRLVAAASLTVAPVVYLHRVNLARVERVSSVGVFVALGLTAIGGNDYTRIFYSFLPIYVLLVLAILRHFGFGFATLTMVTFALVNRTVQPILQPVAIQVSRDEAAGLFSQFPDYARPELSLSILTVWLGVFAAYSAYQAQLRTVLEKKTCIFNKERLHSASVATEASREVAD